MNLKHRLQKLETARVARSDPDAAASFAVQVETLDGLAAGMAAGCAAHAA
jgi:hypothetical protein